jgi:hypothetical protein
MLRTLSISVPAGNTPPTEFCLFTSGVNATSKGSFVFDAAAASSVMSLFSQEGVDFMIDLEHESLDKTAPRADSRDARGWATLELRADGSLWAVDVRWTPDGTRRLSEKTQRYISPAFLTSEMDGVERIVKVINAALVARPATYDAPALVAASRGRVARRDTRATVRKAKMLSAELAQAVLDTLASQDGKAALEVLNKIAAEQLAGSGTESTEPAAPAEAAKTTEGDVPDPTKPKPPETNSIAARALARAEKASDENARLLSRLAVLEAKDKAEVDAARVVLVGRLVEAGAETPETAYEADRKTLRKRLASESLDDMNERLGVALAARPTKATPPVGGGAAGAAGAGSKTFTTSRGVSVTLSADELRACADAKAAPEAYAENKAIRLAARSGGSQ